MVVENVSMKNLFLFLIITFLILTLILIGVSFYFSYDHLVKFLPEQSDFYLHFNFNQAYAPGYQATDYFVQHWPSNLLNQLLFNNFSAFRYNLNPETLKLIDEMAVFYFENQPVIIYKYRPHFANFSLILGGKDRPKIFYRVFDSKTVALTTEPNVLEKIFVKSNKISSGNFSFGKFFNGLIKNNQIKANFNQDKIVFQFQLPSISSEQALEQKIELLLKNFSSLDLGNFVIAIQNKNNLTIQQIEEIVKKRMAYLFPKEVERSLPDGSKVIELVANPELFEFERKSNLVDLAILKNNSHFPNFVLAVHKNYIIFTNKEKFLDEYSVNNNECIFQGAEEIFDWQSEIMGIQNLIISAQKLGEKTTVKGCLSLK